MAEPRKQIFHWQQPDSAKNMERNKNVRNGKRRSRKFKEVEKKESKRIRKKIIVRQDY